MDEYAGRKKDGSLNGQWSKKPATMIRKVALVQALRESFPHNIVSGMYTAEEVGQEEPVEMPTEQPQQELADQQNIQESQEHIQENGSSEQQTTQQNPAAAALFS